MRTTAGSKRLLILVVIAPLLTAGCGKETLPECPHDWDFSKITVIDRQTKESEPLQTVNGSPLLSGPGLQTNVPEFNDCQRLVVREGETARYDSLYAVWARDSMGSMDDTLSIKSIKSVLDTGAAFPMVEILSIGGAYPSSSSIPDSTVCSSTSRARTGSLEWWRPAERRRIVARRGRSRRSALTPTCRSSAPVLPL